MTFNVTAEFGAGSAGTVIFRRHVWLNDNGAIVPPADVTATLAGSPPGFVQALRPTTETGVSPQEWEYEVIVRLDGQDDLVGSMLLTADSDLTEVIQFVAPSVGAYYATKGELSALTEALGGTPVTEAYVDDAVAAEAAARTTDVNTEETARIASDDTLSGEIDAAVADIAGHETRIDTAEAELALIPTPVGATDGHVLTVDTDAFVLAAPTAGGGGGGGILARCVLDHASIQVVSMDTTISDYDSTNLRVTFTAPASGAVLVQQSSYLRVDVGTNLEQYWGLRDLSDVLVDEYAIMVSSGTPGVRLQNAILVTGLTPSAEYTWKWTHKRVNATSAYSAYGGAVGPAIMWVQDASLPA